MCIPSAKFGPYVDASEGWLVDWFVYWSGSAPFLYGEAAQFKYGPYADASGGWLVDQLVYWSSSAPSLYGGESSLKYGPYTQYPGKFFLLSLFSQGVC